MMISLSKSKYSKIYQETKGSRLAMLLRKNGTLKMSILLTKEIRLVIDSILYQKVMQ